MPDPTLLDTLFSGLGIVYTLAALAFVAALLPMTLIAWNLLHFKQAPRLSDPPPPDHAAPRVSLLIPARNEAAKIERTLDAVLASRGIDFEALVLDDQSDDDTAAIVQRIAQRDRRVRLIRGQSLPTGWNGKQHACWELARAARPDSDVLAWIDADVTLKPDALARAVAFMRQRSASLVSGFPHQRTITPLEKLVVPQIMLVLMGYLPMLMMRMSKSPGFGAGCGQFFIADRVAYESIGGHGSIRASMHDGVTLPRSFRKAGHVTDIFDATDIASCRMYDSARAVWAGFAKNATEGMAGSAAIWVWTALLFCGHVLPWLLVAEMGLGLLAPISTTAQVVIAAASALAAGCSVAMLIRFRESPIATLLRPLGVLVLLAIQWHARLRAWRGLPATWRSRDYPTAA